MTKYITPENLKGFKQAYLKAKQDQKNTFVFDDQQVLVKFAKYLIEYFEGTEEIKNKYKHN